MSSSSDSDDFDTQDIDFQITPIQQQPVNIKKYISQPNQLLQKILFCQYQANSLFPSPFVPIPSFVKHDKAQIDPNNMNAIYESHFQHQKLKKDVLNFLLTVHGNNGIKQANKQKLLARKNLPTMAEYYSDRQPIYQKYPRSQKSPSFATYLLDPKTLAPSHLNRPIKANSTSENFYHARKNSSSILNTHRSRIQFSSSFCSGNLFQVYQISHNQFDLILQNDVNTKGNNQWFFFSVKNVPKNLTVKFNIVNLSKKYSLFQEGMKPCIFSQSKYEKRNVGWVREGMKVHYFENEKFKRDQNMKKSYYQLSFQYKFVYEGDVVYFSHAVPYTVSDLTEFLSGHLKNRKNSKLIRLKNLGRTLGNQEIDVIEITNQEYRATKKKKSIWIIARQHPGEVTSSFMMEGIMDKLLDHSDVSNSLLKNYVFKIVPMVNIDGVVHGNSRAEFSGADPNRRWTNPHKIRNPIIYALKKAIQKDKSMNGVEMFLDLHSHSRKMGTFFYGNSFLNNKLTTRKFPMMVCKNDSRFSYQYCRFSPCNPSSARQVLFDYLQIPLVYTVQSSFYGYKKNEKQIVEYLPKDYKQMGVILMESFWQYVVEKYKNFQTYQSYIEEIPNEGERQMEQIRAKNQQFDDLAGSDSDPSGDQLDDKALKEIMPGMFMKKKKKEKKKVIKVIKKKEEAKKEENPSKNQIKIKKNDRESHYRIYFSGRTSAMDRRSKKEDLKISKEYADFGVQVSIPQPTVLKACSNTRISSSVQRKGTLCVTGQKVEEDVVVFGSNIGVQAQLHKVFTKTKEQFRQTQFRKSFKVTTNRGTSLLQTKQNNFLNRADCHTVGSSFNFLTRRNY